MHAELMRNWPSESHPQIRDRTQDGFWEEGRSRWLCYVCCIKHAQKKTSNSKKTSAEEIITKQVCKSAVQTCITLPSPSLPPSFLPFVLMHNRNGWLGVKHQVTDLLTLPPGLLKSWLVVQEKPWWVSQESHDFDWGLFCLVTSFGSCDITV